ncbi:MAG: CBS domain-containing protein [Gammaproteobacteria bacterium]
MFEFLRYRVEDAMTSDPVCAAPDAVLGKLQEIFEARDFNSIPIVDANCALLGVVTKLDILKAFALTPQAIVPRYDDIMANTKAADVMTREPVTASPELPLSRLLQRLVEMRVKSFPVVRDGIVVGVIAREDVLRALRAAIHPSQEPSR